MTLTSLSLHRPGLLTSLISPSRGVSFVAVKTRSLFPTKRKNSSFTDVRGMAQRSDNVEISNFFNRKNSSFLEVVEVLSKANDLKNTTIKAGAESLENLCKRGAVEILAFGATKKAPRNYVNLDPDDDSIPTRLLARGIMTLALPRLRNKYINDTKTLHTVNSTVKTLHKALAERMRDSEGQLGSCTNKDFANTLWSLAKTGCVLDFHEAEAYLNGFKGLLQEGSMIAPIDLANIFWAFSRLKTKDTRLQNSNSSTVENPKSFYYYLSLPLLWENIGAGAIAQIKQVNDFSGTEVVMLLTAFNKYFGSKSCKYAAKELLRSKIHARFASEFCFKTITRRDLPQLAATFQIGFAEGGTEDIREQGAVDQRLLEVMEKLFRRYEEIRDVEEFTIQDLTSLIYSASKSGFLARYPNIFVREVPKILKEADSRGLSLSLWSFAKWGAADCAEKTLSRFPYKKLNKPMHVSNVLHACAMLRVRHEELIEYFGGVVKSSSSLYRELWIKNWESIDLASAIWSLSQLGYTREDLSFVNVLAEEIKTRRDLSDRSATNAVYALALLGYFDCHAWKTSFLRYIPESFPDIWKAQLYIAWLRWKMDGIDISKSEDEDSLFSQLNRDFNGLRIAYIQRSKDTIDSVTSDFLRKALQGDAQSLQFFEQYADLKRLLPPGENCKNPLNPLSLEVTTEVNVEKTGVLVDIAFIKQKIGVEVDGVLHSVTRMNPIEKKIQGYGSRSDVEREQTFETGTTRMKRELLEKMGWRLINLKLREGMSGDEARHECVRQVIHKLVLPEFYGRKNETI